jgi:hypothetical protein
MSVQFGDTRKSFSETLSDISQSIPADSQVTLRRLLELIGEQGLLMFCALLTIPFLIPVSIPGVSTVFGLVIVLIGIGVTLNRIPWLPARLMERQIEGKDLLPALQSAGKLFSRLDRIIRPRLLALTSNAGVNRFNGIMLVFAALLLMAPFGLIPFSNTLPALAVLAYAAGLLQRDGYMVLFGHLMVLVTCVYFGALIIGALAAGSGLMHLIGS